MLSIVVLWWVLALLFAPAPASSRPSSSLSAGPRCPDYGSHSTRRNEPLSTGAYRLAYQRPPLHCRTFNASGVEDAIARLRGEIYDPDLFRLFENTFPNTLDTAVKWRGVAANNSDEELAFLITGDINAMWIRDSANQVAPYKTVLRAKSDDIASVFRGTINLQARYLVVSPYCNAFHPPPESGMKPNVNGALYAVTPPYDREVVFTCNFELDDFGGFLQLSHDYYEKTGDLDFFGRFQWVHAVQSILAASRAMREPTYAEDGAWNSPPPYTFQSQTMSSAGTLANNGIGSPVNYTGMVRSPFRPSDDSALFDFQIPANMMLARYLESTAGIMEQLTSSSRATAAAKVDTAELAREMRDMAEGIRDGIATWGVARAPGGGDAIFAYEVDGFGGRMLMDDANVPSLLSAPLLGYVARNDSTYQATRRFVLGRGNPWWCEGPVLSAVGSPHVRPGAAWPMASIVRALTSDGDAEIAAALREVLASTDGLGLIHESVSSYDAHQWTRQWFTWANGLFGQLIMDLAERKPYILKESFQPFVIDKKT